MSRSRRSPYHSDLGWILGFAFEDTLTRPARLAQEFTFVRCHGSPRASSPHGLTAPAMPPLDAIRCVQLPPARGCYQPAPQRTLTSNPVPMPGTPSLRFAGEDCAGAFVSFNSECMAGDRSHAPRASFLPCGAQRSGGGGPCEAWWRGRMRAPILTFKRARTWCRDV